MLFRSFAVRLRGLLLYIDKNWAIGWYLAEERVRIGVVVRFGADLDDFTGGGGEVGEGEVLGDVSLLS